MLKTCFMLKQRWIQDTFISFQAPNAKTKDDKLDFDSSDWADGSHDRLSH